LLTILNNEIVLVVVLLNRSTIYSLYVEADVDTRIGLTADVIEQSEVHHPLDGAESCGVEQVL